MAARKSVLGLGRVIAAAPAAFGVGLIVFAFSTTLWLSLPALAVMGFAVMTQMAASNTILQTIVDEDKRGRVMSFYATAFLGLTRRGVRRRPAGGGDRGVAARPARPLTWPRSCAAMTSGRRLRWRRAAWCAFSPPPVFASQLPRIRDHIRPIYRRIGILPEVAQGIQEASEPRTAMVDEDLRSETGEAELLKK